MREWADVYRQLRKIVEDSGRKLHPRRDDYDAIHQALLTGLLSGVAYRSDTYEYTGAGDNKLYVWPGSTLFEKRPSWVVAAELVETTRRYCRVVARIDPSWIESIAEHLVKRSYSDPYWDRRAATAMVFERVSLFGLPVVPRRRVPLGPVDPDTARQLFIQNALVEGELVGRFPFFDHNRQVLHEIQQMAAKQRRSDWVVGQQAVFEFYEQRLPSHVFDTRRLKRWLKNPQSRDRSLLHMRREDLLDNCDDDRASQFPDHVAIQKTTFPLAYQFAPGDEQDGVTLTIPQQAINTVLRVLRRYISRAAKSKKPLSSTA